MSDIKEFKRELKELLTKYNASIDFENRPYVMEVTFYSKDFESLHSEILTQGDMITPEDL